jgi:hypothetical protein
MVEIEEMTVEGDRGPAYFLKTLLTLEANETLETAFGQLVAAITKWNNTRGSDCAGLGVIIIAPADQQEAFVTSLTSLIEQEESLFPFFTRIGSISVALGESEDGEFEQFTMDIDPPDEK